MAGEKYLIATGDNQFQITVRNILNPIGYLFMNTCSDPSSLLRMIRVYQPDFVIIDIGINVHDLKTTISAIDEGMLCACVVVGGENERDVSNVIDSSNILFYSPKPISREVLSYAVEMSMMNFKRIHGLSKKLNEATKMLESRKSVEQAKGILMQKFKLTEDEAYRKMRNESMNTRLALKTVAENIIRRHENEDK